MTPAAFDDLLHDCLDERRDPFADAAICAWLDQHPGELERVADLRARLLLLPQLAPQVAVRSTRRLPALLAAAGLAGTAALVLLSTQVPAPGRVFSASLTETPPRAYAAVSFTVREVLAATPSLRLETTELRSLRR